MQRPPDIIGWGADAPLQNRPGVPEQREPTPITELPPGFPRQQTVGRPSVKSRQRPLTPVYATAVPLRGLSGIIRRLAYRMPDYKARRWALLIVADQIDVIEHNVVPATLFVGAIAFGVFGLRALAHRR